jgi:ABC-2 type transport system permease protein
VSFLKKMWAPAKLAILSQFEYRFNFVVDAMVQPLILALIEMTLWWSILKTTGRLQLNGFPVESYMAYVLWSAFFSRITANWMYEFRMVSDIDSGKINSLLVRPFSFFNYYFSQFIGYKISTCTLSIFIPILISVIFQGGFEVHRLFISLSLSLYYLVFAHTLSFCVACLAFTMTKTGSITVIKNVTLWMLTGELFPLDLLPATLKSVMLALPFSSGTYLPVAYLTHRISFSEFSVGYLNVTLGIMVVGSLAFVLWNQGLKRYTGTGA